MTPIRIELCPQIPGPKGVDQPLSSLEVVALSNFSHYILEAVQCGDLQRIVDYTGNYFLLFPVYPEEEKCLEKK